MPAIPAAKRELLIFNNRKENTMTEEQQERMRILRELQTDKCFCGKKKRQGETFCRGHYFALPKQMQRDLYQPSGHGYEEAYAAAKKHFEKGATQ